MMTNPLGSGSVKPLGSGRVSTLLTAFTTVFLAEIGDKTQLATLMLAAQSNQPLQVFIGAGLALVLCSLLSVLLGQWLGKLIPPGLFKAIAGLLMVGLGLGFGLRACFLLNLLPHLPSPF